LAKKKKACNEIYKYLAQKEIKIITTNQTVD